MSFIHCPACGTDILNLEHISVADTEIIRNFQHKLLYDLIKNEERRLKKTDIAKDYRLCKALAACYELQDYIANCIAEETPQEF